VTALLKECRALPLCPEQLGGLATPRPKAAFRGGDGRAVIAGTAAVVTEPGEAVTDACLRGAVETVRLARACGIRRAVLRERSVSCAVRRVPVDGVVRAGRGVTAALLEAEGFELFTPAEFLKQGRVKKR
jgi:uncharacterized protein YbbK (DUF523 family)